MSDITSVPTPSPIASDASEWECVEYEETDTGSDKKPNYKKAVSHFTATDMLFFGVSLIFAIIFLYSIKSLIAPTT